MEIQQPVHENQPAASSHTKVQGAFEKVLGDQLGAYMEAHKDTHVNETLAQSEDARLKDPGFVKETNVALSAAEALTKGLKEHGSMNGPDGQPAEWAKPYLKQLTNLGTQIGQWSSGDRDAINDDQSDKKLRGDVIDQDKKLLASKDVPEAVKKLLRADIGATGKLLADDAKDEPNEKAYLDNANLIQSLVSGLSNGTSTDVAGDLQKFTDAAKAFRGFTSTDATLEVGYKQHLWDDRHVNHQLTAALGRNIYPRPSAPKSQ